jgi:hypothetical protein
MATNKSSWFDADKKRYGAVKSIHEGIIAEALPLSQSAQRNAGSRYRCNQGDEVGEVISASTRARYSTTLVPTVFGMNASGSRAPMACWARQPVQCAGTTTCGFSALRSSMTRGISGSKIGPLR